jgi:hypothetical protein
MVCTCADAVEFAEKHLDLAPGRDPVGRRDPRVCLRIDRPPKTLLNDVELEREVKIGERKLCYRLFLGKI